MSCGFLSYDTPCGQETCEVGAMSEVPNLLCVYRATVLPMWFQGVQTSPAED